MLTLLRGKVLSLSTHRIVVDVGNLALSAHISLRVYERLKGQREVVLHTVLWMPREEGEPTLYGFLEEEERELFLRLLKVPRLGPQKVLAILSYFAPAQLIRVLQTEDAQALTRIKGIGPKVAKQIILEARSLLKGLPAPELPPSYRDAYEGLLALGFSPEEAQSRLQVAFQQEPEAPAERLIHLALSSSS